MNQLNESALAKSWYREPWPWLLMLGPALVIVAGSFTMWLAMRTDDGLVADDYYKRGLAINQTLSRAQHASELALTALVQWRGDSVEVSLTAAGSLPPVLRLRLVHPTQAVADQLIELHTVAPGVYAGSWPAASAGRRLVVLEDFDRTWRLAGEAALDAQSIALTSH